MPRAYSNDCRRDWSQPLCRDVALRASMGISASICGLQKCQPIAGSRLRKYDRLGITEMKLPEVASWG
jgi:hypothetical protein